MGRSKCDYSTKIKNLLKKISKDFYYFESNKIGERINTRFFKRSYDYIFCFRSFYILRKNILKRVNFAAINFHPGPPEYRGMGCVNYALYDEVKKYGCTAHIMGKHIDLGTIINVKRFAVKKKRYC